LHRPRQFCESDKSKAVRLSKAGAVEPTQLQFRSLSQRAMEVQASFRYLNR
jgi:hypothetical protein